MNRKRDFYLKWGITLVLFLIGLFCYMKDYGYAMEHVPVEQEFMFEKYEARSAWGRNRNVPQASQRQQWQEAYDNHHYHAVRTYNDAYNKVWFLPEVSWRQLGRDAWVAACATAGGGTPTARLVIAFSALLSSYGLHCLDEWDYIQDKLVWSQYHFDECQKYAKLLSN